MNTLVEIAPAFVEMAHRIVWGSAATVDREGRPRSRILHPIWRDGPTLKLVTLSRNQHVTNFGWWLKSRNQLASWLRR